MAANTNPAFTNSPAFSNRGPQTVSAADLDELYSRPSATPTDTDRMSYEDTIVKSVIAFGVLLAGAAIGWFIPALAIVGAIAGLVLGLVNTFKKQPSPGLILAYAAMQGLFVGGFSVIMEAFTPGVVSQAVIATLVVIAVTLLLFRSGKIRASAKATKIFLIAMIGYAVFGLINLGTVVFGGVSEPFGLYGYEIAGIPVGVILGPIVIILGAYSLVLDFDSIQQGVRQGAPRKYGWTGAFGILVTVVWLYLEILRFLSILQSND